jgi:hypothetical protein
MVFKLMPILHSDKPFEESGRVFIIFKTCGYCNHGFHCIDVVVTTCKHTFHPFCLDAMLKDFNKCGVWNVKVHLNWWKSWGFQKLDVELMELR